MEARRFAHKEILYQSYRHKIFRCIEEGRSRGFSNRRILEDIEDLGVTLGCPQAQGDQLRAWVRAKGDALETHDLGA